jgi:uncharacterized protein YjiS (DUF1127 family)
MFTPIIELLERVAAAIERRAQRRRLLALDDRMLHDIGRSRADAEAEWAKPLWRE